MAILHTARLVLCIQASLRQLLSMISVNCVDQSCSPDPSLPSEARRNGDRLSTIFDVNGADPEGDSQRVLRPQSLRAPLRVSDYQRLFTVPDSRTSLAVLDRAINLLKKTKVRIAQCNAFVSE
ncbi:hypothetical protein Hypma_005489 [Hypsizygus marmoreus]|uniref:Uncharacterized protein n=1 Tax=Hypsizygus marmoreus TaxID=39966 RepID=A0A369J6A0_HYPMA|nr:hypothetical protein Hypma_005489 [Hypsizygus marmoreus]